MACNTLKKRTICLAIMPLLVVVLSIFFNGQSVYALERTYYQANGSTKKVLIVDKTTAVADGKDAIKITFGAFWIKDYSDTVIDGVSYHIELSRGASPETPRPSCNDQPPYAPSPGDTGHSLLISGENNSLVTPNRIADGNELSIMMLTWSCDTGYSPSYYLKSTKVETKTINIGMWQPDVDGLLTLFEPITVTFTSPTAPAPTPKPTTRKSTVTPGTTAPAAKPALTLTSTVNMQLNSAPLPVATAESPTIKKTDKLTFAGTTSANAKVTLTIKSDPITKEVTADAEGKWSYTLDPKELDLDYGDHTITAYATDTAGLKSDELELAKFTLNRLPPVEPIKLPPHKFTYKDLLTPINYGLGGVLVILIAALGYLIIRRRKTTQTMMEGI